jgi:hypothetical protein
MKATIDALMYKKLGFRVYPQETWVVEFANTLSDTQDTRKTSQKYKNAVTCGVAEVLVGDHLSVQELTYLDGDNSILVRVGEVELPQDYLPKHTTGKAHALFLLKEKKVKILALDINGKLRGIPTIMIDDSVCA